MGCSAMATLANSAELRCLYSTKATDRAGSSRSCATSPHSPNCAATARRSASSGAAGSPPTYSVRCCTGSACTRRVGTRHTAAAAAARHEAAAACASAAAHRRNGPPPHAPHPAAVIPIGGEALTAEAVAGGLLCQAGAGRKLMQSGAPRAVGAAAARKLEAHCGLRVARVGSHGRRGAAAVRAPPPPRSPLWPPHPATRRTASLLCAARGGAPLPPGRTRCCTCHRHRRPVRAVRARRHRRPPACVRGASEGG